MATNPAKQTSGSRTARPRTGVGVLIADALVERGMSQTELARLLAGPLAEPTRVESIRRLLNKWIRGKHDPSPEYAYRLAEILGKPNDHFSRGARHLQSVPKAASDLDAMEFVREAAIAVSNATDDRLIKPPLYKEDIARLLPKFAEKHILVDEVTALNPGVSIAAHKEFTEQDLELGPWYSGTTIVPAVILLEALAQSSAIALLAQPLNRDRIALSAGFNHTRFRKIVHYRQRVKLEAAITHRSGLIAHATIVASVAGTPAVTGECIVAMS